MDEAGGEGQEPEKGEQHGNRSNDFGVDEAALGPIVAVVGCIEVLAGKPSYDGCEGKLDDDVSNVSMTERIIATYLANSQAEAEEIISETRHLVFF